MSHPHQQANGQMDFDRFTDLIHRLLKAAWGHEWGIFTEAFPNGREQDNVNMPVITYLLKEMRPAEFGKGTKEIKPRFRGTYREESEIEGNPQVSNIYGQTMECLVVFEIWEENNAKATALAKRFRDFMRMYTGYFMSQGAQQILFDYQNNERETDFRDNVVCRKQVYKVRLEDLYVVPSGIIEKVTGMVQGKDDLPENFIDQDDSINLELP